MVHDRNCIIIATRIVVDTTPVSLRERDMVPFQGVRSANDTRRSRRCPGRCGGSGFYSRGSEASPCCRSRSEAHRFARETVDAFHHEPHESEPWRDQKLSCRRDDFVIPTTGEFSPTLRRLTASTAWGSFASPAVEAGARTSEHVASQVDVFVAAVVQGAFRVRRSAVEVELVLR